MPDERRHESVPDDRLHRALKLRPLRLLVFDGGRNRVEAKRLEGTALEVFLRRLTITAHKGSQSNWETKTICVDVKAELKRLKEAAEAWLEKSDADVNQALRERLLGFLQRYEVQKAEGALADFQDLLLRARDVLAASVPVRRYFQAKFDRILVDEFQDTDSLQAELVAFLAEDPSTLPAADWREVRAATRIFREVPLAGNASTGRAQGNVDLLFESGRVWRVVDFKTDRYDAHDSVREHMAQLALYSSNLTEVVGADVKPAICLVRLGEIVELR